jgi:hypothetical protein
MEEVPASFLQELPASPLQKVPASLYEAFLIEMEAFFEFRFTP